MEDRLFIETWIDAHGEEIIQLLCDMIVTQTVNPPGNETAAARILEKYFNRYGISSELHEAEPGRGNIIARVGAGGKRLLLAGHLDTVPAGDGWTCDPFKPTFRQGRIYGRGSMDDKGPTAAIAVAAACLKECFRLHGTLIIAGVADEERGSAMGIEYLLRNNILAADWAIIPDSGGDMRGIDIAERGLIFVEVASRGVQAHGSAPERGVNAIWNLIAFLNKLRQRGLPGAQHKYLTAPSYNLGQIQGGTVPNVVPAYATASLDIRYQPSQSAEQMMDWLRTLARETEAEHAGAKFELRQVMGVPPSEVPENHPMVNVLQQVTAEVAGRTPVPVGITGATVTKAFISRGIPAVGFSVGDSALPHVADEYIERDELISFAKVIALATVRLLGAEPIKEKQK